MKRPVRVLILVDSLTPRAGTENQVFEMVRRSDPRRIEIVLACLEDGERFRSLAPHAQLLLFPVRGRVLSLEGWRQWRHLRREIDRLKIDIVMLFLLRSITLGVLGARGSSAKQVVSWRRNEGYWFRPHDLKLFRFLNRFTDRFLANSTRVKDAAVRLEGIAPAKIDVLFNGVDAARFQGRDPHREVSAQIPPGAAVAGMVANFRRIKNQSLFLRAARRVLDQVPEAAFVLVGQGDMREELERLAQELRISERVIFTADHGDVAAILPCFHVGCLTSDSEGFANVILEYMAAGLPVVATDVGGASETVIHGATGYLIPPGDEQAFAEALIPLLRDRAQREKMGQAGQLRCRERFDLDAQARQLEDYCQGLLGPMLD